MARPVPKGRAPWVSSVHRAFGMAEKWFLITGKRNSNLESLEATVARDKTNTAWPSLSAVTTGLPAASAPLAHLLLTFCRKVPMFLQKIYRRDFLASDPTNLLHGTLDMMILKALALTEMHGLGISRRIEQITKGHFK